MTVLRSTTEATGSPTLAHHAALGRGSAHPDVVCYSHLRWDFVTQRPNHLMARAAREARVFFVQEPDSSDGPTRNIVEHREDGLHIVKPQIRRGLSTELTNLTLRTLLTELCAEYGIDEHIAWYYTPLALEFTENMHPLVTVFDCMDELSAFRGAPACLLELEQRLLERADIVFTGGHSLYEAKRTRHPNVHAFPSAVDVAHFAQARLPVRDPIDQSAIAHPRLGFFGVIDERMDSDLVDRVARVRPDWQLVFVGPVVKISESDLPARDNIHYLGSKKYDELPAYISGWDVAIMPFARNESTRFISPTKTPEYLAAGKPVVSTSIRDVVRPYGEYGLVRIADEPEDFVRATEAALLEDRAAAQLAADRFLRTISWDRTWKAMAAHVAALLPAPALHVARSTSALSSARLATG